MDKPREQPRWLIETQNNSWNPELLISGISILFIFAFGDRLNDLTVGIIQDYGVNPVLALFSILYVTLAVQALKFAFVLHLVMRGVWVGLVGLNYTFPKGIRKDKLPKMSRQPFFLKDLKDTIDIIMRVERICSSIFSIAFTIVGISAWIMLLIVPAILLSSFGVPLTWVLVGMATILVVVSISFPVYTLMAKRFGKEIRILQQIALIGSRSQALLFFRESLLTFQTNMNSKLAMVAFFCFFLVAGLQSGELIKPSIEFVRDAVPERSVIPGFDLKRGDRAYESQDPLLYLDTYASYERIRKAAIPTMIVDQGIVSLYCAFYDWDRSIVEADTTQEIHQLVRVTVDKVDAPAVWRRTYMPDTDQRVWVTFLDVGDLSRGEHLIQLHKTSWHPYEKVPVPFEGWCEISFFKD